MRCLMTSETRRSVPTLFPEEAKDASVSECTWTLSALEAMRNGLYKFKTYLLTYLLGIKSMAGLRTFMEEWNRYNTFSHPLKFDELLQ